MKTDAEKIKEKIQHIEEEFVSVLCVVPNKWNFNEQDDKTFNSLKQSILRFGKVYPVIVRELKPGYYELIDGEHRWKSLKSLQIETIPIKNLGKVDDNMALELMTILNKTRGDPNMEKLGLTLSRIVPIMEAEGINPGDVLPYESDMISRIINDEIPGELTDEEWDMINSQIAKKLCMNNGHSFKKMRIKRCKKCGISRPLRKQ